MVVAVVPLCAGLVPGSIPSPSKRYRKLSTDSDKEAPRKGWSERISEVGPAWITAITGLLTVLVGGGAYIAGHASVSGAASPAAQPTATVTVTATVTAPTAADTASSVTNSPQTPHASQSIASNGSKLGSYKVELPQGYSIPLGVSKPTQSQFDSSQQNGDLNDEDVVGDTYQVMGADRMVQLPDNATPTYQACTGSDAFMNGIQGGIGVAFCILENGRIAGVEVISQSSTTSDFILQVTLWRNTS